MIKKAKKMGEESYGVAHKNKRKEGEVGGKGITQEEDKETMLMMAETGSAEENR